MAADPVYEPLPVDVQPADAQQRILDTYRAQDPSYAPNDADLEVIQAGAVAELAADINAGALDAQDDQFVRFLALHGVVREEAAPAATTSTWTVKDANGYTLRAGGQVALGDVVFVLPDTVVIPAGQTTAAGVRLVARIAGAAGNGLTGEPQLREQWAFVTSIELDAPTSGGADEEPLAEFLNRGVEELQQRTQLILRSAHAARVAARVPGVGAALAIDNYAPADGENPPDTQARNQMSVWIRTPDGQACSPAVKANVVARLAARRQQNFVFHVLDPTVTAIDVAATVTIWDSYVADVVVADCDAAVRAYLNASTWGAPPGLGHSSRRWFSEPLVRVNEVIAALDAVPGVRHVLAVTLNGAGDDIALDGPGGLPAVGAAPAITISS